MAQPHEIETLRSMALEEQYNANYEGRTPSRSLLDELGREVLQDFAPALCITPTVYYLDFDPVLGYKYQELITDTPVIGSFGGFLTLEVRHNFGDDGIVPVQKVGYFLMHSAYRDTGYFCPVDTTKLVDVIDKLGSEDEVYNDIASFVGSSDDETVDIAELIETARRVGHGNPNFYYYAALIRSIINPVDVFKEITFSGCYYIDPEKGVAVYNDIVVNDVTAKSDYLQLIEYGSPEPQILLRMGRRHPLAFPLESIIGYEHATVQ